MGKRAAKASPQTPVRPRRAVKPTPQAKTLPGRPSLLTNELREAICEHIAEAIPFKYACEAEGVLVTTAEKWLAAGEKDDAAPEHRAFFEAVTRARARGVILLHGRVLEGGKESNGPQFLLERRYREEYGNVKKLEHSGPDGAPIELGLGQTVRRSASATDKLHDALVAAAAEA